jgi:hypothetical protein
LRTISRIPFGQPLRQSPSSSATQAVEPGGEIRDGRDLEDGLVDGVADGHADRVRQPPAPLGEPGDELVSAASGVGTDQRLTSAPVLLRQLGQGELGRFDVVGRGVAARAARPEQAGHRLPAATASVIDEAHQRMVSEGLLPGRGGVLLLGVGQYEHSVQVHDHPPTAVRGGGLGHAPDVFARFGACGPYRGEVLRPGGGEGVDEAGDRRVGGHRPEHSRLGPQHGGIREAVPAQRDRQGHVQQDLARIVHRPRASPRRQCRRYRLVQPGLAGSLHQQHGPGLGHHSATAALNADTWIGPDTLLHLGSASGVAGTRTSTILILAGQGNFPLT